MPLQPLAVGSCHPSGVSERPITAEGWRDLRDQLDERARASKRSQEAAIDLAAAFARLSDAERSNVVPTLDEWLLSDDEALRFDALYVVAEHSVAEAVPALRVLQDRLEASSAPGAPYEWAKVNRLIAQLDIR